MSNNGFLPKQTQQKKIMKKYEVVQKLWGFYGSGAAGSPKRDKYGNRENFEEGLPMYHICCYKYYIHILVLLVESNKKKLLKNMV